MNLKDDLKQIVIGKFAELGITYPDDDLRRLCIHYFNLQRKIIESIPRRVIYSREALSKSTGQAFEVTLKEIENKFVTGLDVNGHLSKRSMDPDYDDYLLNDWQIHHFHISTTKRDPANFFYDRSGFLLFALVLNETTYFIDIRGHNERSVFAKTEMLEIIDNNWPELIEPSVIKDAIGVEHKCTDDEILMLRKANINVVLEINGKIICSIGRGYTASGDSIYSVDAYNHYINSIEKIEKDILFKHDELKEAIEKKAGKKFNEIDFRLELIGKNLRVREVNSGFFFA